MPGSKKSNPPPLPPPPVITNPEETAFRHTFLYRFEKDEARSSLRCLGDMLADYLDESGQWGDAAIPTVTHGKLRAVAADLREIEAFLDQLRRLRYATVMEPPAERLVIFTEKWVKRVGKLAAAIEREVFS
jgi:hypothetical protein